MADPYVPPPVGAVRPWWARRLASEPWRQFIGYLSAVPLVLSIVYGAISVSQPNFWLEASIQSIPSTCKAPAASECQKSLTWWGISKVVILLIWIVVPPCWFWFEYFGLYRYDAGAHKPDWDSFKYGQDVSSKVWLALATTLTILYFGKDIRG